MGGDNLDEADERDDAGGGRSDRDGPDASGLLGVEAEAEAEAIVEVDEGVEAVRDEGDVDAPPLNLE